MTRRLAVFQMHHTDREERLLETNAVRRTVESGLFDEVVVAAADLPENRSLERFADAFGCDLVLGAERNVAKRIADVAEERECELVARSLVWWFFQDLDLVRRQLDALEVSDAEGWLLPPDFDLRFGADVFRASWVRRVGERLEGDAALFAKHALNPWSFVEAQPDAHDYRAFDEVPVLDRATFESIRSTMRALWPERWDGAAQPMTAYKLALEHLKPGGRSIDVACGLGAGTALLAARGPALGIDIDAGAIEAARQRSAGEFLLGDVLKLDLPAETFDVAVSVHTMEHVEDDRAFLEVLHRALVPGGKLVLEVPLLMRDPFRDVETPLSPGHVREYERRELVDKVSEFFRIDESFGMARGARVPLERARNAAGVVGTKR